MRKLFTLILFLFLSAEVFSQSDSVLIYNTGNIFAVEIRDSVGAYANMDVSDESLEEVKIISLTDSFLEMSYVKNKRTVKKSIDVRQINEIGYKNGKSGGSGMLAGFGGGLVAGLLTLVLYKGDKEVKNGTEVFDGIAVVALGATMPVLGAIAGLIIGAQNDNYKMLELAKMNRKQKYDKIKSVIEAGILNNTKAKK